MFDDIRPFVDAEIPDAMQRIAADPHFPTVSRYLFPTVKPSVIGAKLMACRTVRDFQQQFMYAAVSSVMKQTTDGVTVEGLERLSPDKSYLFVSNHRDIVLDAAFLQVLLEDAGLPTSEITFGANLMEGQLVTDIGKSNKMFRVERPTTVSSGREFLERSCYLSEYIRYTIVEKHESVWIAQRNGRTKDGDDRTDRGIINMFILSGKGSRVEAIADLNLVPIAISYEWEPCDFLKALELYARSLGQPYIKHPGEDLNSILTGITQPKGRVHLHVGTPLTAEELAPLGGLSKAVFTAAVAEKIDHWIFGAYHLFPNNYIAYDMLHGGTSGAYTDAEKEAFQQHLSLLAIYDGAQALREIVLRMYAAPVENVRNCNE